MLIAAAVCPHPPLLIPAATGVSGPGDTELERLRTACHEAVAALRAAAPDLIVVVGGAERTGDYPPEAPGSLRQYGVPFLVGDDEGNSPVLPLSLTIGRWLLTRPADDSMTARGEPQAAWWGIAADAAPGGGPGLGEKIAGAAHRGGGRRRGSAWNWARRSPCSHRGWRCSPWAMVPAVGPAAPRVPAIRLPTATTTRWRRRWPRPAPARWPRWTRPPTMTCSLPAGPPGRSWPARRARTISAPRWPTRRHRSRSATSSPPGGGHTRGMDTHFVAVVGATATGKSGLGIALARALGGEVVNADSMQLYQGMDIGTAKEPAAARQGVPHHLLDVWPVTQTANVADYQKLARTAIEDIAARGRIPEIGRASWK